MTTLTLILIVCVACAAFCSWAVWAIVSSIKEINRLLDQHRSYADQIIESNRDCIAQRSARLKENEVLLEKLEAIRR